MDPAPFSVSNNLLITTGTNFDQNEPESYPVVIRDGSSATLAHNLILTGENQWRVIAVSVNYDTTATLVNNIIQAGSGETIRVVGMMGSDALGHPSVTLVANDLLAPTTGCLLWIFRTDDCFSTLTDLHACALSECAETDRNVAVDPAWSDGSAASYHLGLTSELVDAGVDPSLYRLPVERDLDGNPRPRGKGWNIGPDERHD